jgi:hypothetical protein
VINEQNWIRNRDLGLVTIEIYINDRGFKLRNNPYRFNRRMKGKPQL